MNCGDNTKDTNKGLYGMMEWGITPDLPLLGGMPLIIT